MTSEEPGELFGSITPNNLPGKPEPGSSSRRESAVMVQSPIGGMVSSTCALAAACFCFPAQALVGLTPEQVNQRKAPDFSPAYARQTVLVGIWCIIMGIFEIVGGLVLRRAVRRQEAAPAGSAGNTMTAR